MSDLGAVALGLAVCALVWLPGLALLSTAAGNGSRRPRWPEGAVVSLAAGVAVAGLSATVLGLLGIFGIASLCAALLGATGLVLGIGRFRVAAPFSRAPASQAAGLLLAGLLAAALFPGRPFEMLLGGRDATTYLVAGVALSRQGSLVLRDDAAAKVGPEAMRELYPPPAKPGLFGGAHPGKYQGFYYLDDPASGRLVAQGLPLLPALIAVAHEIFGLEGAFSAVSFVGILAVVSLWAVGASLVGPAAATVGSTLLALNLVEVWAARYPVGEILFQMLLLSGLAAFLWRDRVGDGLAGLLLGATLFTKIEAGLLLVPVSILAVVALARDGGRRPFLVVFGAMGMAAAAYWIVFQESYIGSALQFFLRFESKVAGGVFGHAGVAAALGLVVAAALATAVRLVRRGPAEPMPAVARALAVGVVVFGAYGYWLRPLASSVVAGQVKTFLWLSWYVTPFVLLVGIGGLAWFLWSVPAARSVFAVVTLLVLSGVFLHFTFVNFYHIYMTRRFVPAVLPTVCLFYGYAVSRLATMRIRGSALPGALVAAALTAAGVGGFFRTSAHLYSHTEYAGLADRFRSVAGEVADADLVLLSDRETANLLGPALEFVFGVDTLVMPPGRYREQRLRIREWLGEGRDLAALARKNDLGDQSGAEEFELVRRTVMPAYELVQRYDVFPDRFARSAIPLATYRAGPRSDRLWAFWQESGDAVSRAVCGAGIAVAGGTPFAVRRVRRACPEAGVDRGSVGYLVATTEAAEWESWLEIHGARFDRRDLGAVRLLENVSAHASPEARRLSPEEWVLSASDGRGGERLAVDGRLDTRWGSSAPQRPGMTFTIELPGPTEVEWLRLRSGSFPKDAARRLAVETSVDGAKWTRIEIPEVAGGIVWRAGRPEERPDGSRDLRIHSKGIRFVRLVNLGESSHFDWSIAELEIDGTG